MVVGRIRKITCIKCLAQHLAASIVIINSHVEAGGGLFKKTID